MKKTTKKDKVESYLEDLMKTDGFTTENLMNTTVYDLFGNAELEGIGKTTLSGALNLFKKKYGLKKPGKGGLIPVKNTKKERVERYLTSLMKSPEFGVHDLMDLTVYDLFGNSELEGIGKTTLSSGISTFKKKYLKIQYKNEAIGEEPGIDSLQTDGDEVGADEETLTEAGQIDKEAAKDSDSSVEDEKMEEEEDPSFEEVFISAIVKEDKKKKSFGAVDRNSKIIVENKATERPQTTETSLTSFNKEEIAIIKNMIGRFKAGQMNIIPTENFELIELKHALQHFGVDYKTILDHYRKNSDR